MEKRELQVETRHEFGKGPNRRLRSQEMIPDTVPGIFPGMFPGVETPGYKNHEIPLRGFHRNPRRGVSCPSQPRFQSTGF